MKTSYEIADKALDDASEIIYNAMDEIKKLHGYDDNHEELRVLLWYLANRVDLNEEI